MATFQQCAVFQFGLRLAQFGAQTFILMNPDFNVERTMAKPDNYRATRVYIGDQQTVSHLQTALRTSSLSKETTDRCTSRDATRQLAIKFTIWRGFEFRRSEQSGFAEYG